MPCQKGDGNAVKATGHHGAGRGAQWRLDLRLSCLSEALHRIEATSTNDTDRRVPHDWVHVHLLTRMQNEYPQHSSKKAPQCEGLPFMGILRGIVHHCGERL